MNLSAALLATRRAQPARIVGTPPADIVWEGPLTVSAGDTYTDRNFRSLSWPTSAATINTSSQVNFINCRFWSMANCISGAPGTANVTLTNCIGYCAQPNAANSVYFLNLGTRIGSLIVENCTANSTIRTTGGTGAPTLIRIRYNRIHNVEARESNGAGGWLYEADSTTAYRYSKPAIQVVGCEDIAACDISWNEMYQQRGEHTVEDFINIGGDTSGVTGRWGNIDDNFMFGNMHCRPFDLPAFSGCGILFEGTAGYFNVRNNTIVSGMNIGIHPSAAGNHDLNITGNYLVSAGSIRGRNLAYSQHGIYCTSGKTNVTIDSNTSGWISRPAGTASNFAGGATMTNGVTVTATEALEDAQWQIWRNKCATNSVVIGSSLTIY